MILLSACEMQALGLASSRLFPDSSFTASSSRNGNEAFKGRLNGVGAWSPSTDGNANDYLQINLQYEFFICAVGTQGSPTANDWTTKYKLLLSLNGSDWVTYQQKSGVDKVCINTEWGVASKQLKRLRMLAYIKVQTLFISLPKIAVSHKQRLTEMAIE